MNKQFNLELAKQGHPVETKSGLRVEVINFNYKPNKNYKPGLAVKVYTDFEEELIDYYCYDGTFPSDPSNDLIMITKKIQLWQNIYKIEDGSFEGGYLFNSEKKCKLGIGELTGEYITTVKIEFEN